MPTPKPRGRKSASLQAQFCVAAQKLAEFQHTSAPRPKRRGNRGGGGHRLTTAALADSYLKLCHDPCKDLHRWIAEDKKRPGLRQRAPPPAQETRHEITTLRATSFVEDARRLCGRALHQVQGRLDTHGNQGRIVDDLSARSRAGAERHDTLRSLRAEGRGDLADVRDDASNASGEFASELGALSGYFAARRAAIRRSSNPGDVAAALRALQNEQTLATRAVIEQWMTASRNTAQRRQASIMADRKSVV